MTANDRVYDFTEMGDCARNMFLYFERIRKEPPEPPGNLREVKACITFINQNPQYKNIVGSLGYTSKIWSDIVLNWNKWVRFYKEYETVHNLDLLLSPMSGGDDNMPPISRYLSRAYSHSLQ